MDFLQLFDQTKISFITHQNTGNRYHYPDTLKRDAVSLLNHYSPQILSREFGISVKSLKNWQTNHLISTKEPATFVPLKLTDHHEMASMISQPSHSITLKLPHNLELILPAQSIEESAQFVCRFIREFSRCSI